MPRKRDERSGRRERDAAAGPPSQRPLRVGEAIRHALAQILASGRLRDPVLFDASITVTEARVSPDLKNATVFVMPLAGAKRDQIVDALNLAGPYLRGEVARLCGLRHATRLHFVPDASFDRADQVETLLRDPRVRRDTGRGGTDADG